MYAVRDKTRPPSLLEKYNARTKSANTHYPRPPNSARSATRPRPGGRNLPDLFQSRVPRYLYDIGRESGTTPICNKCKAETFYCKHRIGNGAMTARRVGNLKTSAMVIGSNRPNTVAKPSFGRKSHIKAFYDSGHIRTH